MSQSLGIKGGATDEVTAKKIRKHSKSPLIPLQGET